MSRFKILMNFLIAAGTDNRLGPTHVSLYVALLKLWADQNYRTLFTISRSEVMPLSKISGFTTYHKKLKDLHNYGYIKYDPNFDPYQKSQVRLVRK
ncbi:MAG: hypothetical protein EOP45_14060 [Sphingobacteriaceae bacterium]|nr:MAG: hypothetical protein EOP45_14060 [Sphingobacteriaceae bacterium]